LNIIWGYVTLGQMSHAVNNDFVAANLKDCTVSRLLAETVKELAKYHLESVALSSNGTSFGAIG